MKTLPSFTMLVLDFPVVQFSTLFYFSKALDDGVQAYKAVLTSGEQKRKPGNVTLDYESCDCIYTIVQKKHRTLVIFSNNFNKHRLISRICGTENTQ